MSPVKLVGRDLFITSISFKFTVEVTLRNNIYDTNPVAILIGNKYAENRLRFMIKIIDPIITDPIKLRMSAFLS